MRRVVIAVSLSFLSVGACAGDSPEVPVGPDGVPDPVLVLGRDIYADRCATCHGSSGDGDRGPKISEGSTVDDYPEVADQVELVERGKGAMPAFGDALTDAELTAVVRYVREVL